MKAIDRLNNYKYIYDSFVNYKYIGGSTPNQTTPSFIKWKKFCDDLYYLFTDLKLIDSNLTVSKTLDSLTLRINLPPVGSGDSLVYTLEYFEVNTSVVFKFRKYNGTSLSPISEIAININSLDRTDTLKQKLASILYLKLLNGFNNTIEVTSTNDDLNDPKIEGDIKIPGDTASDFTKITFFTHDDKIRFIHHLSAVDTPTEDDKYQIFYDIPINELSNRIRLGIETFITTFLKIILSLL